jgi:hypothetical protein
MIWCDSGVSNLSVSSDDQVHCVVVIFVRCVTVDDGDIQYCNSGGKAFVLDKHGCAGGESFCNLRVCCQWLAFEGTIEFDVER